MHAMKEVDPSGESSKLISDNANLWNVDVENSGYYCRRYRELISLLPEERSYSLSTYPRCWRGHNDVESDLRYILYFYFWNLIALHAFSLNNLGSYTVLLRNLSNHV